MEILEISDVCNIPLSLTYEKGGKKEKWGDYETKLLLSLWNEYFFELRNASRNAKIYMKIAAELRPLNPRKPARTAREVKIKITNLSKMWRRERSKEINEGCTSSWLFFDVVGKILGYLPCENDTLTADCLEYKAFQSTFAAENDDNSDDPNEITLDSDATNYHCDCSFSNNKSGNGGDCAEILVSKMFESQEDDSLDVFGRFIVAELRNITDPQVLQNTKFCIQKLLHEAQIQ